MRRTILSFSLALCLVFLFGGLALARSPGDDPPPPDIAIAPDVVPVPLGPALTLTYGQVINGGAAVYDRPGGAVVSRLAPGFVFVSLASSMPVVYGGLNWYPLRQGGYVPSSHLLLYPASQFHGVQLDAQPQNPFAWVIYDSQVSAKPGAAPAAGAAKLTRYTRVDLLDQQNVGGVAWYRVGDGEWVSQYRLGIVKPSPRPASIGPNDKWIEVNLFEQTLAAYEGDRMVYATLVASGLPKWDTTPGLFKIYDKIRMERMTGEPGQKDYYYLQDIPWIMYFDNDQALHTAYWHDGFGAPHSHGCVNLPPQDAQWLWYWATPIAGPDNHTQATDTNPGTWVWVHY